MNINELLNKKILITGGAGFIGSNLVDQLITLGHQHITVLDNLETGSLANLQPHLDNKSITFINGSICDAEACTHASTGVDVILHQAALGSVPRSIENPVATHNTNVNGFINILEAARKNKVKRVVYASSSSVYGSDLSLPKREEKVGTPLSPYAVSKKTNELYAYVYATLYNMELVGLRYFNVFGPKQNPNGPYAAVIPIFINNILNKKPCVIYGDGENLRDFTYVDNVVQANLLAAVTINAEALNEVYNIAYGSTRSVKALFENISSRLNSSVPAEFRAPRPGEIKDSFADVEKAGRGFGYTPLVSLDAGIEKTIAWYRQQNP